MSCALSGFERVGDPVPDAGVPDVASDALLCEHKTAPPPPSGAAPGGTIVFSVAMHTIDLGDAPNGPPLGLDLDKTCTCQGEGPSCTPPDMAKTCDQAQGVDNGGQALLRLLETGFGADKFSSKFFSDRANEGAWSLIIRVQDYNGMPNDDQVEVDVYPVGGRPITPASGMPAWDGKDVWPVLDSSLTDNKTVDLPRFRDTHAYVTNNVLVAGLAQSSLTLAGGTSETLTITLTAGEIIGTIKNTSQGYALTNGLVAARWTLANVFATLSSYRDDMGKPFCKGGAIYDFGKKNICGAADILSTIGSPTDPCDSISFAVGFTADPMVIAPTPKSGPAKLPGCMPPSTDPINDSCF